MMDNDELEYLTSRAECGIDPPPTCASCCELWVDGIAWTMHRDCRRPPPARDALAGSRRPHTPRKGSTNVRSAHYCPTRPRGRARDRSGRPQRLAGEDRARVVRCARMRVRTSRDRRVAAPIVRCVRATARGSTGRRSRVRDRFGDLARIVRVAPSVSRRGRRGFRRRCVAGSLAKRIKSQAAIVDDARLSAATPCARARVKRAHDYLARAGASMR